MNERRDDLSTADLAAQQPTDTAPPDRTEGTGFERRDVTADDPGREERRPNNLPRDAAVLEGPCGRRRTRPRPTPAGPGRRR
jgi:hypothetical protein